MMKDQQGCPYSCGGGSAQQNLYPQQNVHFQPIPQETQQNMLCQPTPLGPQQNMMYQPTAPGLQQNMMYQPSPQGPQQNMMYQPSPLGAQQNMFYEQAPLDAQQNMMYQPTPQGTQQFMPCPMTPQASQQCTKCQQKSAKGKQKFKPCHTSSKRGHQNQQCQPTPPGAHQIIPYPPTANKLSIIQGPSSSCNQSNPNCPSGLEYLLLVDHLAVHQELELLDSCGFKTQYKYTITNCSGQRVFYAVEDSICVATDCCGIVRPFDMRIFNNFGEPVLCLNRPIPNRGYCCLCYLQTMDVLVQPPPCYRIGTVEEKSKKLLIIRNSNCDIVFHIKRDGCCACCCVKRNFKICTKNGKTKVGTITKKGKTGAYIFCINFPMDLDVKMKATLLGAVVLMDYVCF